MKESYQKTSYKKNNFTKTNWISEFTKLKKSIPKNCLHELESENSTKTAEKTNTILDIKEKNTKL